jgi:hypothetical protein
MLLTQFRGWAMGTAVLSGLITTAHAQTAPSEPPAPAAQAHDNDNPPIRLASPSAAPAPPSPLDKSPMWRGRPFSVVLRLGADFGGDEIFSGTTSNGDSFSMTGGGGGVISGGFLIAPDAPYAFEITIGYKATTQSFSNGSISFSRVPVDAIASFAPGNHRLGIGVTAHFAPTLDCSVTGVCTGHAELDTSYGVLLQWAYTLHHLELGLRATFISYHATDTLSGATASFNGNSFGGFVGVRL